MSEPQPSKSPETNAGEKPATAGGGMASVAAVGARLAELRRTKGWSVDDVSARLKVAAPKLQALEAGDTSQLPGTTFALGLVRSYAKMLGVDPEPFAQALRREKACRRSICRCPRRPAPICRAAGCRSRWGGVARPAMAVGGRGGRGRARCRGDVAYGRRFVELARALQVERRGRSRVGRARAAGRRRVGSAGERGGVGHGHAGGGARGVRDAVGRRRVGGRHGRGERAGRGAAPVVASAAAALSASAPVAAAQPAQGAQQPAASAADGASAAVTAAPGQSVVALKVAQDCWFSVRDKNGKELFSALVRAGETRQVAGDAPLKVTIGNKAGLESVAFDGKPVDPAKYSTARGNVARFALP